ncbi:Uncharacterized conserved protein, DUF1800 family [Mucilaginibacter pineti]|uniref:Uncharacterized conserved protein, DUF1800 family n=1 Tax=Mucilaginibacter pineti TaxID=1391627 RepID=A0A1G6V621_9SPHI|nr:DUF1800 domain-containing protein [Mucilaginibacter pineti]SDD48853.1 Uncharacterized conserved protein, DUF1800 family [Mucilaginibacter pineti]
MKKTVKYLVSIGLLVLGFVVFSSFFMSVPNAKAVKFPYRLSGLTERQAAAHLLSRFTYGATPGEIDQVVKSGLESWFNKQLEASLPDDSLNQMLAKFDALKLNNAEIVSEYPKGNQVLRMAISDGVVNKDSVNKNRNAYKDVLKKYMDDNGMKPEQELYREFINQKVLRSAYTNNQLQEVMTDFWFNHFNVSITKGDCAQFIPDYERDVIRPNALGKFNDILLATAKSPAMLYYLDNFSSVAANNDYMAGRGLMRRQIMQNTAVIEDTTQRAKLQKARKTQGINENYAREVMELHTLGVDGGYTQQDVTQAAKVLTGWTIYPMGQYNKGVKKAVDKISSQRFEKAGFVHDGDFLFNSNRHDNSEKVVMGKHFGPDGGYQEGVNLLAMLAHNPSTAKFITKKIAVRFVSDNPPQSLLDKMSKTFMEKDGDIKQVLITMVDAPEFWNASAVREKTKSPFELAIGAARSLHAEITQPYQLYNWVNKMGEKIYYYQAPTGFPDKGQYWINTGALLNRMNFGLALASGRIPGIRIDLAALNNHHEPESAQAALVTYCQLIMPERKLDETIKHLTPLLNDPTLMQKVDEASANTPPAQMQQAATMDNMAVQDSGDMKGRGKGLKNKKNNFIAMQNNGGDNSMLSQVVGVIIGSPEYQRR